MDNQTSQSAPLAPQPTQGMPQAPVATSKTDVLGIISIILAVLAVFGVWWPIIGVFSTTLAIIGLILGLIGAKNAKRDGRSAGLSRGGWIASLVITIIGIIFSGFWLVAILYGSAKESQVNTALSAYHQQMGTYPTTLSDLHDLSDYKDLRISSSLTYTAKPDGCISYCTGYVLNGTSHGTTSSSLDDSY